MSAQILSAENAALFSTEENDFIARMAGSEVGQLHLFQGWPERGIQDAEKRALVNQAMELDGQYPGGLSAYVGNARRLLQQSRDGVNPYDGFQPAVPSGERLRYDNGSFAESEKVGLTARMGFVLVAGGLGERLGYNGIKVELPAETVTGRCFLGMYVDYILEVQRRSADPSKLVPLCIMTSGDTHERTVRLLESNNYFGAAEGQITIVKQEKVPALVDNSAKFAVDETGFRLLTKPHGHGDVHILLHSSGVARRWLDDGVEFLVFFQDTNAIVIRAVLAAVGVSKMRGFALNSLTVPRRPGEPVGGICKLSRADGSGLTINVEYNQLDPLLRATTGSGDIAAEGSTFSAYPGNINVLIFQASAYTAALDSSGGSIPEFVNPKYADEAKERFKKPTRLECMMQDFPKLFDASVPVGFTEVERWLCFSAVKNNPADALVKYNKTGFAESASTGEADIYIAARRIMNSIGVAIEVQGPKVDCAGIPTVTGARVILTPRFGLTIDDIRSRFPEPKEVSVSARSTLLLDGPGTITIKSMKLDGALIITAVEGANVVINSLSVANDGAVYSNTGDGDAEKYKIRGYKRVRMDAKVLSFEHPGEYTVG